MASTFSARIMDGMVVDRIVGTAPGYVPCDAAVQIGWAYDGEFSPPISAEPVPAIISDRQFAQGLAVKGLITEAEALAWVSAGALPTAIDAFVASLPAGEQFSAQMILRGATTFDRHHPFTGMFGTAVGMTDQALDNFWRECATL